MEQTKAQYFAMYLGQRVMMQPNWNNPNIFDHGFLYGRALKNGYLSLRTVEQLTDEEYLRVAEICIPENKGYLDEIDGKNCIRSIFESASWHQAKPVNIIQCYQYLISIGICLSDEAVAKGWVILTNPK